MLKKTFSLLVISAFLTTSVPVRPLPAEGTKQSVAAQKSPCKEQKSEKPVKQSKADASKTPLAVHKTLTVEKPEKTHRKWYICIGNAIAGGIVSYYRLQPNSPLDHPR